MKILLVFILALLFPTIHGLACIIYDKSIELSFEIVNSSTLKQVFTILTLNENNDDVLYRAEICIRFTTFSETITIEFTRILDGILLADQQIRLDTAIIRQKANGFEYLSNVEYACSYADGCEKKFLLDNIDWILNTTFIEFQNNIRQFLIDDPGNRGNCYDKDNTVHQCLSTICQANRLKNEIQFHQECLDEKISFLNLHLTTYIDMITYTEEQNIHFTCQYNLCNSNETLLKIQKYIDQYYDLSLMRKTLGYYNKSIERDKTTSTISTTSQSTITTETIISLKSIDSKKQTIHIFIIPLYILFFLFFL